MNSPKIINAVQRTERKNRNALEQRINQNQDIVQFQNNRNKNAGIQVRNLAGDSDISIGLASFGGSSGNRVGP